MKESHRTLLCSRQGPGRVPILNTQVRPFSGAGKDEGGYEIWEQLSCLWDKGLSKQGLWPLLADLPSYLLTWPQAGLPLEGSCDQSCRPPGPFPARQHRLH